MKCHEPGCQGTTTLEAGRTLSNLPFGVPVVLFDARVHRCDTCGAEAPELPAMSLLLDQVGYQVATKPVPLTPGEFRYLRERLGMTRQQLAGRLGLSRQAVRYWETGERIVGPHKEALLRILVLQRAGRTSQGTVEVATTAPFGERQNAEHTYRIVLEHGEAESQVA